jgi:hypothetical protein
MSYPFSDLVTEVKARSIRSESGTQYDARIKNVINTSLFRLARESNWRVLRRDTFFDTVAEYSTGTGAVTVTNDSVNVTVTGATFITDGIDVGRRIDLGGSTKPFQIRTITGETTLTVDSVFDGDTSTTQEYKIFGQEFYNLPIQAGKAALLWHQDYGYPVEMGYVTDPRFYAHNTSLSQGNTPVVWRQWGMNSIIDQPLEASVLSISSSSTTDTSISVTVFGTVSGFPDFETVATNSSDGTTAVSTTKSFSDVERITKAGATTGRITVTANSGNATIGILPVGDTTGMVEYLKIGLFPYPTRVFPINVLYYKDPWRLVNDGDIHELGHQFDEAIILMSTAKLNFEQNKKEGNRFLALYVDEVKNLKKHNVDKIANWMPSLRRVAHRNRGSQTGSRFLNFGQLGGQFGPRTR